MPSRGGMGMQQRTMETCGSNRAALAGKDHAAVNAPRHAEGCVNLSERARDGRAFT